MRYLTIAEVLETYQRVMQQTGGLAGIRDLGALESAIAQPYMTFGGKSRSTGIFHDSKSSICRW